MRAEAHTFFVHPNTARPPFGLVASFLWGAGHNVDSDGDSRHADDQNWTELTLQSRQLTDQRIDIDPVSEHPLVLKVASAQRVLAARAAYFLASATEGSVSHSPQGPFLPAASLEPEVGMFDLGAALRSTRPTGA